MISYGAASCARCCEVIYLKRIVATNAVKELNPMERKQITYFYDAVIKANETEIDVGGDRLAPMKGDMLLRPDKQWWKVEHAETRHDEGNVLRVVMH